MKHCGLDMGKRTSHFCIIDDNRKVVRQGKLRNRANHIEVLFGSMAPMRVVIEASGKAFWMAEQLLRLGHQPIVVDPGKTKAIGAAGIKHDKLDARVLAELCRADLLAEVDRPTKQQRLSRMPVVVRDGLVRARSKLINTVRSIADSEGVEIPSTSADRFSHAVSLVAESMPEQMLEALRPMLDAIEKLTESIRQCDQEIEKAAKEDEVMQLLQTCPGVGPICAAAFAYAIRDPERFSSGRAVGAYLGLVPSLYASGKTYRRGRITKCGNRQARWLLTMAANALLRSKEDNAIKRWGCELASRIGRRKAVVAVARKLAAVLWAMWMDRRPFEARLPEAA